ncbi:RecB family exonuclease [Candidatus Latescibacterota bacterium]
MSGDGHLSVTQFKTYLRCPLQYFFRYGCGIKVPPTGDLVLGRSVHSALKENYRQKLRTYEDLPLDDISDIFSASFDREAESAAFEKNQNPGELKDKGIGLISAYQKEVAPGVQPAAVEQEFLIETGATQLPLKGYIDLIDDQGIIIDHKTSKKSYAADAAEKDLQLTAYALAYRSIFGEPENGVRLDVMVKNKTPKIQQLSGTRDDQQIKRFLRIAQEVERGIGSGVYFPNESYMCRICGYGEMCEKW